MHLELAKEARERPLVKKEKKRRKTTPTVSSLAFLEHFLKVYC